MSDQNTPPGPQFPGQGGPQYPGAGGPQFQPQQAPYQNQPQGQPYQQQGPPPNAPYEQMQMGGEWQPEPPKKKRGKLIPIVAALAMVVVVAGGGIFAYGKLNGGGQPDAVLPGTAIGYLRVDLNPSAGQKLAALRFLMKFPSAKDKLKLTGDKDDLRQKLFEALKSNDDSGDLKNIDYAKDVEPWMGDRVGIAVVPAADAKKDPSIVFAVQSKDDEAAGKALDKGSKPNEKVGRAFTDGYMIVSETQAEVDAAVTATKSAPLADNAKYKADLEKLGEPGFATLWADFAGIAKLAGDKAPVKLGPIGEGSMAAALRFDAQYVELKGIVRSDQEIVAKATDASELVTKLPDTTAAAISVSGVDSSIDNVWKTLEKSGEMGELVQGFAEQTGLKLPDDLKNLLGKNLSVVVDKDSAAGPKIAARLETDPAKAEPVLEKLTTLLQQRSPVQVPLETAKDGDTLVVSTDKEYAAKVLQGGNLGASESFKLALPDVSGATGIAYVDFDGANGIMESLGQKSSADIKALRSAGMVARNTGNFEGEFTLRVVAK
ncbi:DUF3352 domain-containing protein [Kribbella sp. NBC_01505]|uniref:DUF3352 domain-containing protein n=1 Tax=Kribbella sp. NBC_01505 TaxID=2903580 RepID=UPI00386B2236